MNFCEQSHEDMNSLKNVSLPTFQGRSQLEVVVLRGWQLR